jgi:hypothetical protein
VPTDFLTLSDIAQILDVKPASARVYHEVAQRNRREAKEGRANAIRPTDMPEPFTRIGRTPVWTPDAIDEWQKRRIPRRRSETTEQTAQVNQESAA